MSIQLTDDEIARLFFVTKSDLITTYTPFINQTLLKYNIQTVNQVAAYMATIGEESGYLQHIEENLNYSAIGLQKTFPSHFAPNEFNIYAHNPERIANRVYANRLGNGNEASGDGWRYRGRGLIQITGKAEYTDMLNTYQFVKPSNDIFLSMDELISFLGTPEGATLSSGWFWNHKNLTKYDGDIVTITKLVNGGLAGIDNRKKIFEEALMILTPPAQQVANVANN